MRKVHSALGILTNRERLQIEAKKRTDRQETPVLARLQSL